MSSSASGNQWYLNGNLIGGATNQTYNATAGGDYTVTVTASGCPSAASAPTTVTVQPTSITVTNTNDSGNGALRQAIAGSHAQAWRRSILILQQCLRRRKRLCCLPANCLSAGT